MSTITNKTQMEKLKGLALSYYGAQKAKKEAEQQLEELRIAIMQIIDVVGHRVGASTKSVDVAGLNLSVRESERVYAVDGAEDYVRSILPDLRDRLLEEKLNVKEVEKAAADDAITAEDIENLVLPKTIYALYVKEAKGKK